MTINYSAQRLVVVCTMPCSGQGGRCELRLADMVCFLLSIPFIGVVVCVAQARAEGAAASTISEMVTVNPDMEIVFAISMGAAALAIAAAMWLLFLAITKAHADAGKFYLIFLLLTILMIFGCGALARFTLRSDAGAHVIYAAIAFVSQWIMLCILVVMGHNAQSEKWSCVYIMSAIFCFLAFVCLVLFGTNVTSKAFYFEFALLISMYVSTCCLACVPWNIETEQKDIKGAQSGGDVRGTESDTDVLSITDEREVTRFNSCDGYS